MSWLADRAAADGSAEALRWAGRALDYATLAQRAGELARALAARGIAPGEPVAALASGALEMTLLLHAAQALGCALLPLGTRLTPHELQRQLAASGARALVCDAAESERAVAIARALGLAAWRLDARGAAAALALDMLVAPPRRIALARGAASRLPEAVLANALGTPADVRAQSGEARDLLWLFTSGTTGEPKAARLSQRALRASADGHARSIGLAAGERWLACMPMFHVGGLSILVRCALAGASAELHDRFEEDAVADALASGRIALASLVPAMLSRLLDAWGERPPPPGLRCILLGGAAAPPALLARARALRFPIAPTYGLTEAASQVATRPPEEAREPLGARLRALPGTSLRIVDDDGKPLPAGAEGEICVRGPTLMSGYAHDPAATARALRDGWLHTGDAGRLDDEGHLEVLDRRTDLIVSGGENLYPAEIEAALHEHPAVAEAGVVARADARWGARPVAFVALRAGRAASEVELRAHCAARLARFKLPDAFVFTEALPRNASGKLLRRVLRERAARRGAGDGAAHAV